MTADQQLKILAKHYDKTNFNFQESDGIEWARWSWNPITGCLHDCKYCYARDAANRLFDAKFVPAFYPGRLQCPQHTKVPAEAKTDVGYRNVFTCSMADLFGKWVPSDLIGKVLDVVRQSPQWNFLFLTKYPTRLLEFDFPANAWVGTTVDTQERVKAAEEVFEKVKAKVKWISAEPMMERLTFEHLDRFHWIVLGGASKSTQTPEFKPPREWVNHLWAQALAAGCKIYEKPNLLERSREYPTQVPVPVIPVAAAVPDGIIGQLQRIKLSREKGAKLPLGTVVVTRGPGRKWGNPFEIDVDGSRSEVIAKYKNWLTTDPKGMETLKAAKEKLRGKNLACSCDLDEECHGDFLLKMVNEVAPST